VKYLILSRSILAASFLALSACGNPNVPVESTPVGGDSSQTDSPADVASMKAPIEVEGAFIRPPFPGREIATGYFDVTNHGADDRLISASSPVSDAIEIHTNRVENGVMQMRRVDGVDLPSGETVSFKPGGYHLMMFATFIPESAEAVAVTLNYEKADPMTFMVPLGTPVEEMKMDMEDGHKMKKEMDHGAEH